MFASEVAAMIGVEDAGDATDLPAGIFFVPDRLAQR
jgi:hypothetical protein